MTKKGNLFVVSGPTAAGKGTICAKLCERRPDIKLSVSCTTRAMRPGEIDGVHYFFVSDEKFNEMILSDELLEHAGVHGKQYGTPRGFVMEMLSHGQDVILEIDVQGAKQVKAKNLVDIKPVFVIPPSKDVLVQRLRSRGTETEAQIAIRLKTAQTELLEAESYPYLIVNDDLDEAIDRLEAIIDASHAERAEHVSLLHELYQQFQEV